MENSASELLAFSRDYLLPLSTRKASSLPSPEWDSPQNQPHLRTVSSDHLRQFWKQTPRWVSVQENRGHTCEGRWAGNRWKLRDIGLCWSPDAWEGEKRRGCLGVSGRSDVPKLPVRGVLRLPRRGRLDHRPGRAVRVPGVAARPSHI